MIDNEKYAHEIINNLEAEVENLKNQLHDI